MRAWAMDRGWALNRGRGTLDPLGGVPAGSPQGFQKQLALAAAAAATAIGRLGDWGQGRQPGRPRYRRQGQGRTGRVIFIWV